MNRSWQRLLCALVIGLCACLPWVGEASAAEKRIALVVGNGRYAEVPRLSNPAKDAEAMSETLRRIGFSTVTLRFDLGRDAMNAALHAFAREAERADWAVVYFAGHGIEYAGTNYLVPVDATLASDRDVQFEALALNQVLGAVEGARKLRLVILDACRDNPFLSRMKRSVASRSVGRGLLRVEPGGGVLVAFAAKDGEVAFDGDGSNSPFTGALIKHMQTPGLEINRLFRRVRSEVLLETNQRQEPYVYGSLPDEDFYFSPATPQKPSVVVETSEPEDRLNGPEPVPPAVKSAPISQPVLPTSVGGKLPDASVPGDSPSQALADGAKKLDPSSPVINSTGPAVPEPAATPARVAAISPDALPEGPASQSTDVAQSRDLSRAIQAQLRRLGCDPASTDGDWSEKNRDSLKNYSRHAGRAIEFDTLDDGVLKEMKNRRSRVCPLICARGYVARKASCVLARCPRDQIRGDDGNCVAAPHRAPPERKIAHNRTPQDEPLRRKPIDAPRPRVAAPPPISAQRPRIATPAPKPVARAARPAPVRVAPARRCQIFNGQSICD